MRSLDDLTMYVYGLLDPAAEEAMKDHLYECAECSEIRRRIAAEHGLLKGALKRGSPEMPAWTSDGASRHRRRI